MPSCVWFRTCVASTATEGETPLADFVDTTVKDIDDRLRELKDEVAKARGRARRAGRRPPRTRSSRRGSAQLRRDAPARRRPGRPRGRRGGNTRANQALELVRDQPGITIPQIAEALKIEPNYLYRVMPKLVADGQVTRDGQGWQPASSAASGHVSHGPRRTGRGRRCRRASRAHERPAELQLRSGRAA